MKKSMSFKNEDEVIIRVKRLYVEVKAACSLFYLTYYNLELSAYTAGLLTYTPELSAYTDGL